MQQAKADSCVTFCLLVEQASSTREERKHGQTRQADQTSNRICKAQRRSKQQLQSIEKSSIWIHVATKRGPNSCNLSRSASSVVMLNTLVKTPVKASSESSVKTLVKTLVNIATHNNLVATPARALQTTSPLPLTPYDCWVPGPTHNIILYVHLAADSICIPLHMACTR